MALAVALAVGPLRKSYFKDTAPFPILHEP